MRILRSIASVLVSAAFTGACLDLSPLPYQGPEGGVFDGSVADVVFDVSPDAPGGACAQCLRSGCKAAETACEQNTKCSKFAACMSVMLCWGSSLTDLTNLSPCLATCGVSAGLTSQADPASALITPLLACAQDPKVCASVCVVGAEQ
jgi:hypothetical protein